MLLQSVSLFSGFVALSEMGYHIKKCINVTNLSESYYFLCLNAYVFGFGYCELL